MTRDQGHTRVGDAFARLAPSDLRLFHEGACQLFFSAWLAQGYALHFGLARPGTRAKSRAKSPEHRVTFRDEHSGELEEIRFFEIPIAEQIVKVSPRVPEKLSDFLLEEFDFTDGRADTYNSIRGSLVALALSQNGLEVVLRALSLACDGELRALTGELEEHVLELACSSSGSEVLQFCIENLSSADAAFIVVALVGKTVSVAENPFGREVLRTLLERMPPVLLTPIVDELPSHTLEMCTEAFTRAGLQAAREGNSVPGSAADGEESDATELIVELYEVGTPSKHGSLFYRAWVSVALMCTRSA